MAPMRALTIGVMNGVIAGETVDRAQLVAIDQRAGALALLSLLTLFVTGVLFCFHAAREPQRECLWFPDEQLAGMGGGLVLRARSPAIRTRTSN